MNSKLGLALVISAAVAGLALAQAPYAQDPVERLTALEQQVEALKGEVATLRKSSTSADLAQELAKTRATTEALVNWAHAQSLAATAMQAVLDESRAKGFTAGINPDSRETLLRGWGELLSAVKGGAPAPEAPPAPAARGRGQR